MKPAVVSSRGERATVSEYREKVAKEASCLVAQVETEVVVPVELASDKRERAARTLRPNRGAPILPH